MSKTLLEDRSAVSQAFFGMPQFLGHMGDIPATDILQFSTFKQIPDALLWIKFRSIAGQAFQMEPFGSFVFQKVFDHLCTMDRCPIPDDEQVAWNLAQQETQEANHILGIIGMILRLHEQPSLSSKASDSRKMIPRQFHTQHRSVSSGSVGPHSHRQQVEAGFIYKDDGSVLLLGFFLSAGQRSSFQRPMAVSSRWLACCTGFCTLYFSFCRSRLQWPGW